jgi:hypothetical protein
MSARANKPPKKANAIKGYISSPDLVLFAFATTFFSRLVDSAGAPSVINFAHFAAVPFACGVVLLRSKSKDRHQIAISWQLIAGMAVLLGVMFASAILNNAGVINVVMSFLLLGEPFVFLLAVISIPMSPASLEKLKTWVIRFCFFHTLLAFVQRYVLNLHRLHGLADNIQGVFYRSGAGHVVGASVAMTFGLYYLVTAKTAPLWFRIVVFLATFWHMLLADAKQVLLSFLAGWLLLLVTKIQDIGKALQYIIAAAVLGAILAWCIENVEAFGAFKTWMRPEIYGPEGEATLLKTATFRIVPQYYDSFLHPWLGLGPGHTVGRLGGWMLSIYSNLLGPLGSTRHPASREVWRAVGRSWLGDQSSMFSPLFGWAGIWGDLGFLGLAAYLYLAYVTWSKLSPGDLCRFLLLSVFVTGLIFSQMEEPGYMLFIALIIGLRWQEERAKRKQERDRQASWLYENLVRSPPPSSGSG